MKMCCQDMYNKAEKLLSSSLNQWGSLLASSDNLNPVWAQILSDPFLRRLLLRYISAAYSFPNCPLHIAILVPI